MHTHRELALRVGDRRDVAKHVDRVLPIGGKKTFKSGRVTSSGNMPPVWVKRAFLRSPSSTLKRSAIAGRYQTGSIAAW